MRLSSSFRLNLHELKRTVPIWKKEVFEDGEVWVEGEDVSSPAS